MENNYGYSGQDNYQPGRKKPKPKGLKKLLWIIPLVVLVLILSLDSFYTLKEGQYAVITTFGKPSMVSASGLQPKLPLV